jgi:NifU-like protein involved in Fe-S cluster formation
MYSQQLLEHFEHPRNVGELEDATVSAQVENPACGDIMQLSLRVGNGTILAARYRTRGCVASIASGSALTERLEGMSIVAARKLRREELLESLGTLGPEQVHATHLAMDALHAALAKL